MGIEEERCRLLLRRRRRPSISIYAFHILSARHCLLLPPPFPRKPILYLRQENKHVATAAKAGMQSPFAPLPLRAFRRASGGLINFIWSKRAATYTHTVSLSHSIFFSPPLSSLSPRKVSICTDTLRQNRWISHKVIFSTSIVVDNNLRERHKKILIIIEIVHFINTTFFFVLPLDLYLFD